MKFQYLIRMFAQPRLSLSTKIIALLIVFSAAINRQLLDSVTQAFGRASVSTLIWCGFVALAAFFLFQFWRVSSSSNILGFLAVLGAGIAYCMTFDLPEERMHILKYGLLGSLIAQDQLRKRGQDPFPTTGDRPALMSEKGPDPFYSVKVVGVALLVGGWVAVVDEIFQWWLPYRVGDIRDVVFGVIGSAWGGLCMVAGVRTPFPHIKHA